MTKRGATQSSPSSMFEDDALLLSLAGWRFTPLGGPKASPLLAKRGRSTDRRYLLTCQWCHRTVGSWNFLSSTSPSTHQEEDLKRHKSEDKSVPVPPRLAAFDAFSTQHLSFCPWVHTVEDERPGWEQVLDFYLSEQQHTSLRLKVEEGYHQLIDALN